MARNRKRAKERRARRPAAAPISASARLDSEATPDPIEHAAPDVELAEAQLALGRPDVVEDGAAVEEDLDRNEDVEAVAVDADAETAADPAPARDGGAVAEPVPTKAVAAPADRERPGTRLVTFLQGSWRELQRVQWPDRRQVMQATGVVIGFVIVAGAFLGVADALATKLMNFIMK